jgi:hypothetical protein
LFASFFADAIQLGKAMNNQLMIENSQNFNRRPILTKLTKGYATDPEVNCLKQLSFKPKPQGGSFMKWIDCENYKVFGLGV